MKTKTKHRHMIRIIAPVIACGLFAIILVGCGKKISVRIQDMYTETRLETTAGKTVGELLSEAEIKLGAKDEAVPSLDTVISKDEEQIQILRFADVQIIADDQSTEVELVGKKVKEALGEEGITLGEHDYMNHDSEAYLTDGMSVEITRRVSVSLRADGEKRKCITEAKTVEEFLKEQGVVLGDEDRVKPKLSKELEEGTKIVVKRVNRKMETETQTIAYGTQTKQSSSMNEGTSKVTRKGVNGEKEITYSVVYVDGEEESREVVKEVVTKEPISEIVTKGTKKIVKKNAGKGSSSSKGGKKAVSKKRVEDCDGSGHGYYIIKYSDGSTKYVDF